MRYDQTETKAFYRFQVKHGEWENFGGRTNLSFVFELARQAGVKGRGIIDLGCGDGDVAQILYDRLGAWAGYVGVDLLEENIAAFEQRRLTNTHLTVGDATDMLMLRQVSTDLVLCLFMIQDLPQPLGISLIHEVSRVLSPTGCAIWALTVAPVDGSEVYRAPRVLADKGCPMKYAYTWGRVPFLAELVNAGLVLLAERAEQNPNGLMEWYVLTTRAPK